MKIAIDYDDTYSADRELFSGLIMAAKRRGHDVRFVTARHQHRANSDINADAKGLGIDIIFTDGRQKQPVTQDAGWEPDVWIDDQPSAIPGSNGLSNCALL